MLSERLEKNQVSPMTAQLLASREVPGCGRRGRDPDRGQQTLQCEKVRAESPAAWEARTHKPEHRREGAQTEDPGELQRFLCHSAEGQLVP